jgi:hypothetical protein
MFEIGKTYTIKSIDSPAEGEITILESYEKQTRWLCVLKFSLTIKEYASSVQFASFHAVLDQFSNYWETEEGYIQGCNTNGEPKITTFAMPNEFKNVIAIENLIIKYVDNLDLVEKLYEKIDQNSLPSRNQ